MTRDRPNRSPRRRFLRAFARWADNHRADPPFALRPALLRDGSLTYTVAGAHPALTLIVRPQEVRIDVHHAGRFWDVLECFETVARREPGSYRCALCLDQPQAWPTREALWLDHCFEPLAVWMAGPLASARWLDLCVIGGASWAQLTADDQPPADLVHRLPIRT